MWQSSKTSFLGDISFVMKKYDPAPYYNSMLGEARCAQILILVFSIALPLIPLLPKHIVD
jgi:hypothetical protein